MNNASSTSRGDEHSSRGNFFHNITRTTFTFFRRLVFNRGISRSRSRNTDFESFERLLREEFSVNNTSDIDIAQHLATFHVSFTETSQNCTIYINGYNNGHDKIIEGVVDQDLTRNLGSECYISFTEPGSERLYNRRFQSPYEAKDIKAFFEQFSSNSEDNA